MKPAVLSQTALFFATTLHSLQSVRLHPCTPDRAPQPGVRMDCTSPKPQARCTHGRNQFIRSHGISNQLRFPKLNIAPRRVVTKKLAVTWSRTDCNARSAGAAFAHAGAPTRPAPRPRPPRAPHHPAFRHLRALGPRCAGGLTAGERAARS